MQAIVWFLGLFVAAVALALFAGDNVASVTVFWPPYRVDMSLNLVLLLALAALGLLYGVARTVVALFALPRQARGWRREQQVQAITALMLEARLQLLAGQTARASAGAEAVLARLPQALVHGPSDATGPEHGHAAVRLLARLTAAEAALALGELGRHRDHLQAALASIRAEVVEGDEYFDVLRDAATLSAAHASLRQRQPGPALEHLQRLPAATQNRVAVRRLRLQAWLLQRGVNWGQALNAMRALARRGLLNESEVMAGLCAAEDEQQLGQLWCALDDRLKAARMLGLRAAERGLDLGAAPAVVRERLLPLWQGFVQQPDALAAAEQEQLLAVLERSLGLPQQDERGLAAQEHGRLAWLQRIEEAQGLWPDHALLQAVAERVSVQQQLW